MNKFESELLNNNPQALICGIDEVGRGPLAGPVDLLTDHVQPRQYHRLMLEDCYSATHFQIYSLYCNK
jgi:ribonuclease HIII